MRPLLSRSDEPPSRTDPLLGWRLWRVRDDGSLLSWGVRHAWQPGVNQASCLAEKHCDPAPGRACSCGFWAVFGADRCLRYGRDTLSDPSAAFGLVRAWGEIALHGREGFRAQHGAIVCLFSDWLWPLDEACDTAPRPPWWRRAQEALLMAGEAAVRPAPGRETALQHAADRYAVPLLSVDAALRSGFLAEQGIPERAIDDLRRQRRHRPSKDGGWADRPGRSRPHQA